MKFHLPLTPAQEKAIKFASSIGYSTFENNIALAYVCQEIFNNNIHGDLVETGVAAGSKLIVMGATSVFRHQNNPNEKLRTIWGYDSFEGILNI